MVEFVVGLYFLYFKLLSYSTEKGPTYLFAALNAIDHLTRILGPNIIAQHILITPDNKNTKKSCRSVCVRVNPVTAQCLHVYVNVQLA